MDNIFCLIKFGEQRFVEKLFKEGEIFFGLPTSFNDNPEKERGDQNEGAEWIDNTKLTRIQCNHSILGTFDFKTDSNSPSKLVQYNYYFLLFSLYAITSELFKKDDSHKIDSRIGEFGDTALVISEPYTFLNSVISELERKNMRYEMKLVTYRDLKDGRIDTLPFDKKQEHTHQCEFRIIIENIDDAPKLIKIGSIEKYSRLVDSKSFIESAWTVNRKPTA